MSACRFGERSFARRGEGRGIRQELVRRGDLVSLDGVSGVYVVNVPYANLLEVSEEQIIQEANPWAVFGFLTAMAYHNLTDLAPKEVYAIWSKGGEGSGRLPLGSMPDDWTERTRLLVVKRPEMVRDVPVHWTQLTEEPGFGVIVGYSFGVPIYLTDVERTILDAFACRIRRAESARCSRRGSRAEFDTGKLVKYTDAYENKILRQRVGYLLEKLGRTHPRLEEWRHGLQRGGR